MTTATTHDILARPDLAAQAREWLDACESGDTPLGIFADWLQEHGDEARAEYIRVGVELDRRRKGKQGYRLTLVDQLAAILAANPQWIPSVSCPRCGFITKPECRMCAELGDLMWSNNPDGHFPRIDPARDFACNGIVPIVTSVGCRMGEVVEECGKCNSWGRATCEVCRGSGHHPTPWASLVAALPFVVGLRVTDRTAVQCSKDTGSSSFDGDNWWSWMDADLARRSHSPGQPSMIPGVLIGKMREMKLGKLSPRGAAQRFPTPAAADRALARACYQWVKGQGA